MTDHRLRPGRAAKHSLAVPVLAFCCLWAACGPSSEPPDAPDTKERAAGDAGAAVAASGTVEIEPLDAPSAPDSMAPELALLDTPDGPEAALTWLEPAPVDAAAEDATPPWRLRFARLGPPGWSEPVTIVTGGPGGVEGEGLAGEDAPLFANWADRPGLVQGAVPEGEEPGAAPVPAPLFAHWLAMNGDSVYAYEVRMARSDDGGRTWRGLGRLHEDDQAAEHGFVSYVADPRTAPAGGGVRAVWLDGRATPGGEPMTLRTALVGESVDRASETLLDDSVCDCCSTTGVATASGPLVVYRDRTADEVRDHFLVRGLAAEGAARWSEPELLHEDGWTIPACPVNGPVAGVSSTGPESETVWIAWFTAAAGEPRVRAAVSNDGGATFGEPIEIDGPATGAPLGRLDLAVDPSTDGGSAVVSWLDREDGAAVIRLRRLSTGGRLGPTVDVARSATSRASGVPRLLALPGASGTRLLVAWVDPGDSERDDAPRNLRLAVLSAVQVPSADSH